MRKALDAIVPFYETYNSVKDIVAQGPKYKVTEWVIYFFFSSQYHLTSLSQLDEFLQALSRIDAAVAYFTRNSRANPELRRLQALNADATVMLEAQFTAVRR